MSNMNNAQTEGKPWYKEFWGWFVFAPLIFIACVCSVLLTVAYSLKDDVVTDDYYKKGRMINNTFAATRAAQDLGLTAMVAIDATAENITVSLNATSPVFAPEITLIFSHPMESGLDKKYKLVRQPGSNETAVYTAATEAPIKGRHYLQLSYYVDAPKAMRTEEDPDPKVEAWRVVGELDVSANATVTLTP
ncbi:FixH family protein [Saccharophagus degradans]|uniref:FixH n=1 Tax=Saccharophagus degradans (strain 2-40 / ATCC 43961 / DSM 17024) TaxID=203122 RepID=Q21I02_SACD2|nr:FixH family protein [Saccharophagus degradans]ABD81677.1 conserved hypothetical protein [Saccharophagus degradans 2-40]